MVLATLCTTVLCTTAAAQNSPRAVASFDANWLFQKSDAVGAEQPEFNDSAFRELNVPHDWSIEGPIAQTNPSGGAGGFFPDGIGWYRKHFSLGQNLSAK